MTQRLSRGILKDDRRYPERIVQFGGGNFLRGFVDWAVDVLNDESDFNSGIVLVKATPGAYDALDQQDCLFTTHLHGVQDGEYQEQTRLIRAVNRSGLPLSGFRGLSGAGAAAGDPLHLFQYHRGRHRLFL